MAFTAWAVVVFGINYAQVFRCLEETGYAGLAGFELIPKTTTAEAVKAIMRL